jgi:dolichyl-phosphate-mannose--protein O-mannosyl transferase
MTPVTPFLALGLVFVLRDIAASRISGRVTVPAVAVVLAVVVGVFVFFWPVLTGDTVTYESWGARMWLDGWI